jgi:hypothetical protein
MSDHTGSGNPSQPQPNDAAPDLYAARITGTRESLDRLMKEGELDMGCRPHPEVNPDGTATLLVYATAERIRELQAAGYTVEPGDNVSELGRQLQAEVGEGDRFKGGRIAPRGLGEKPGHGRKGGSAA